MLGDPGQDVGQPGLRIDIVQLGSDIEPLLAVWHAIRDQVTIGKCLPEPGTIRLLGG